MHLDILNKAQSQVDAHSAAFRLASITSSIVHKGDDRLRFCLFRPYIRRRAASSARTQLCGAMSRISITRIRSSAPDDVCRILDGQDADKSEKRIAVSGAAQVPCGRCGGDTHCGGRTGIGERGGDGVLAPNLGRRRFARSSTSDTLCYRTRRSNLPHRGRPSAAPFCFGDVVANTSASLRPALALLAGSTLLVGGWVTSVPTWFRRSKYTTAARRGPAEYADRLCARRLGGAVRSPMSLGSTWLPDCNVNVERKARTRLRRERPPPPGQAGRVTAACA